mmetsp:Transcript_65123/g.188827  ORF Transcript_65123/g.188827 Transcript_65123/m.188827 type:complete len:219 (-) Transcript_65123:95-751(-)
MSATRSRCCSGAFADRSPRCSLRLRVSESPAKSCATLWRASWTAANWRTASLCDPSRRRPRAWRTASRRSRRTLTPSVQPRSARPRRPRRPTSAMRRSSSGERRTLTGVSLRWRRPLPLTRRRSGSRRAPHWKLCMAESPANAFLVMSVSRRWNANCGRTWTPVTAAMPRRWRSWKRQSSPLRLLPLTRSALRSPSSVLSSALRSQTTGGSTAMGAGR